MPKFETIQNNFNTGEISSYTLGRSDIEKYHSACEAIYNYIPMIQGGAYRRPGTLFIANAQGASRLIPFQFNSATAYVLEFGPTGQIRFYKNHAVILSGMSPLQVAHPYASNELFQIKFAQFADIMYLVHPNHPVQKLNRLSDTSWILSQPSFRTPPTFAFQQDVGTEKSATLTPGATSGSGVTFTASANVFIAADIGKKIIAGAGVAFITAIGGASSTDGVTGATIFAQATADIIDTFASTSAIAAGSWFLSGPPGSFLGIGTISSGDWLNSRILGPGSGTQTAYGFTKAPLDSNTQANSTGGAVVYPTVPFQDTFRDIDAGSYIIIDGAVAQIKAIVNSHQATIVLLSVITVTFSDLQGNQQVTPGSPGTWTVETPSFTNTNGFPAAVCFFQDRLCFAGTTAQPQTVWMSVIDDYENFSKGTQEDDSIDTTINSGFREQIQWLAAYQGQIVAGTLKSEYIITGGALAVGGNGPAITPSNVTSTIQSSWGVASIQPVFVENDLIYIQRSLQRGFQFAYDIYRGVYASKNLNIFNSTITSFQFREMVYWQSPFFIIAFTDTAGNLVFLTYNREQDVWAWSRQITGNTNTLAPLNGDAVQSIASIINPNQLNDDLWMCVGRAVNGSTSYFIEVLDPSQNINLDSAITATGSGLTSISGLSYLRGRQVYGVLDPDFNTPGAGDVVGPFTVPASGIINFALAKPTGAANITFGLNYTSTLQTIRLDLAGAETIQGKKKRWARIFVRLYNSLGLTINGTMPFASPNLGSGQVPPMDIPFRVPSNNMTQVIPLITPPSFQYPYTGFGQSGDVETTNLDYDYDGRVLIQQTQPLPSIVLALFGAVTVGEM